MTKIYVIGPPEKHATISDLLKPLDPNIDVGNHIGDKPGYSELRAQYWVWKNESLVPEKVGFFQFRRYLSLVGGKENRPYFITRFAKTADYEPERAERFLQDADVVAPLPEYTGVSVWNHYAECHREEDLLLIREIIKDLSTDFMSAADDYLNGKYEYYANMYIMRWSVFDQYMQWLFCLLSEYDKRAIDIPPRTQGYLAERLFGIWFTKVKMDRQLSWKEVPRIHFWGYDDKTHHLRRDKLVNLMLPPGTKRRAAIRSFLH